LVLVVQEAEESYQDGEHSSGHQPTPAEVRSGTIMWSSVFFGRIGVHNV
jgi:hypothetical protein